MPFKVEESRFEKFLSPRLSTFRLPFDPHAAGQAALICALESYPDGVPGGGVAFVEL